MSTDAVIDIDKRTNGDAPVTSVVHNPYGSPPGSGVTLPPGYQPTPSVKNKNNYFPQSEPLGPDEMRIIFMGLSLIHI